MNVFIIERTKDGVSNFEVMQAADAAAARFSIIHDITPFGSGVTINLYDVTLNSPILEATV